MRNVLMAIAVVGLLATPSLADINIMLTVDKPTIDINETATVTIWGQSPNGLLMLGGRVTGDTASLSTVAGSMVFDPAFNPPFPFGPPRTGVAATNGGWGVTGTLNGWGTGQTNMFSQDPSIGVTPTWARVASYQVTGVACGVDNLTFVPGWYGGFRATEVTGNGTTVGTITGISVTVTPEPATLSLLALGGLLIARRRRA